MAEYCKDCGGYWVCGVNPSCDEADAEVQAAAGREPKATSVKWYTVGTISIGKPGTYVVKLSRKPSSNSEVVISPA